MLRMSLGWNWEPVPALSSSSFSSCDSGGDENQEKSDRDKREAGGAASPGGRREEEKETGLSRDDRRRDDDGGGDRNGDLSSSSCSGETEKKRRRGTFDYLNEDDTIRRVLQKYREMNKTLSFVLPVGAFCLFQNLLRLSGDQLFCLIGDKGYPTADEFAGERDPHIAIHGSVSFMLNLHSIRLYFDALGEEEDEEEKKKKNPLETEAPEKIKKKRKRIGFSMYTPYRDTFQITGLWCSGAEKSAFPRSRAAFLDDLEDMTPDGLIQWQRSCQETLLSGGE